MLRDAVRNPPGFIRGEVQSIIDTYEYGYFDGLAHITKINPYPTGSDLNLAYSRGVAMGLSVAEISDDINKKAHDYDIICDDNNRLVKTIEDLNTIIDGIVKALKFE